MKRFSFLPLLPLAVTLLLSFGCESQQQPSKTIVILYENDVHCAIDGYAPVAGYRDALADSVYVGLVSAGDYLQGGDAGVLSHGSQVVEIMNEMGYDAVTLGNHEFDYFAPRLFELVNQLKCPVVCANLFDAKTGERCFPSYVIKSYGPTKVAFVGVLTPEAAIDERYAFYDDEDQPLLDLRPAEVYTLVQEAVDQARSAGAAYVVVLSHMGEQNATGVTSAGLVAATKGIDAVLDGHSHETIPCHMIPNVEGTPVPVSQTGTAFANVGKLTISTDGAISVELVPLDEITQTSAAVAAKVDEVKQENALVTSQKLADSEVTLRINSPEGERLVRKAETNAGDFLCDALRYVMDAEVAFSNGGGIRADIPAGEVTYGDVIRTFPFDNFVYKVEATGAQLIDVLRVNTANAPANEDGNFPQCAGIRCVISAASHTVLSLEVLGSDGNYVPVDPAKIYTVATTDYCVKNGGFNDVLKSCKVLDRTASYYREAVSEYITNALGGHIGTEYAESAGRIIFK